MAWGNWIFRAYLACAAGDVAAIKDAWQGDFPHAAAERAGWDPVKLSPSGNLPATHFAINTALTAALAEKIRNRVESLSLPLRGFVVNAETGLLIKAYVPGGATHPRLGTVFTFEDALADRGLQRIILAP